MASTDDELATARPGHPMRLATRVAVAITAGVLLAGCGNDLHTGAEEASVQGAVKAQIRSDAARQHVALSELECMPLSSTKLACLAHVKDVKAPEEATATIVASFDNHSHNYLLEGPSSLIGSG